MGWRRKREVLYRSFLPFIPFLVVIIMIYGTTYGMDIYVICVIYVAMHLYLLVHVSM